MIPTPALPDRTAQSLRRAQDLVARAGSWSVLLPGFLGILAHRNDRLGLAQRNRLVTGLGVVGAVAANRQQRFVWIDLPEQAGQYRRIAHRVGRDLDRPDLQRLRVDSDVQPAPLAPVLGAVLLPLPLAFAHHLQAGAVDQQV